MASAREILGDSAINALLDQGHSEKDIVDMAIAANKNRKALAPPKVEGFVDSYGVNATQNINEQSGALTNAYETSQLKLKTDPQYLADEKQRLRDAKQLENPVLRFFGGDAKAIMENARGTLKAAEWMAKSKPTEYAKSLKNEHINLDTTATLPSNFTTPSFGADAEGNPTIDTTPKLATEVQYSKPVQTLGGWIKEIDTKQKNYQSTIGDKWDVASALGETAGGFIDPINAIPFSMATRTARMIGFSLSGAGSGGLNALGGDKDVGMGMATGAIAAPIIGETLHSLGTYGGKLLNKYFNDVPKDTPVTSFEFDAYADGVLKTYAPEVKQEIITAVKTGEALPSFVSSEVKEDLFRGYEVEKGLSWVRENEEALKSVDSKTHEMIQKVQAGEKDSILASEIIRRELLKMQKDGASATEIQRYINAKSAPTEAENTITHLINDGVGVEPRFSSYRVLYALEKSMQLPTELKKTPEEMFFSLKKAGFVDEAAGAFSDAYAKGDISLAQRYFQSKLQSRMTEEVMNSVEIRPYSPELEKVIAKEKAVNDTYDAQTQHLKSLGEEDGIQAKSEQAVQGDVQTTVEANGIKSEGQGGEPIGAPKTPTLDAMLDAIKKNDVGGGKQSENFKAQMQAWADGENVRLKEMGLEPTATAEEMAKRYKVLYANRAPEQDEINRLLSIVSDESGNVKTMQSRNKSHGWQDVTSTDTHGQPYIRRMAGERGLDSEITTPVATLKKLKEQGYEALSPDEKIQIKNDVALMREHPDFREADALHVKEDGMLYDGDGNMLFQAKRLERTYLKQQKNGRMEVDTEKLIAHSNDEMPHPTVSKDEFLAQFKGKEYVDTPVGRVAVDLEYHWNHIDGKNTTGQKRHFYGGTIEPTLRDPLFVVKKEDGSEVFFKPFKNGEDGFFVTSITRSSDGKLNLETHYDPSLSKVNKLIRVPEKDFLYWRFGAGKKTPPDKISLDRGHGEIIAQKLNQDIKGAYTIDKKLIEIFDAHDVSTLNHELGHRFLFTLNDAERAIAERIFEVKNGKWSVENHEAFADAYARYIAEGKTPVKALQSIFERFKQFTLDILDNLRANNGGKMPKLGEDMETFFAATMGHEPSRAKLFSKMQDEGVLFQKGADERIGRIEDEAMRVQAEHAVEKSIKLHGGFAEPLLEMITAPLKKLQTKMIDGFDALGKVKPDGVKTVRTERVSVKQFELETSSKLEPVVKDDNVPLESEIVQFGGSSYEIVFGKDGKREIYRLGERNVYENSVGNTVRISNFDNIEDAVTEMIHLRDAAEENARKRAVEHMEVLSKFSKEDQVTLGKALDGDEASMQGMSEQLKPLYETYRKLIDDGAELLVRYGFLDEKEQIKEYVRRLYLPYVMKQSLLERFRTTLFSSEGGFGASVGGIGRRKEMSLEERIAKGQIFDASYVIPVTRMEQEKLLIRGKYYEDIAKMYGSLEKIDGYGQVPNEPFKFGNLSGKYIPRQLYDAVVNAPEYTGGLLKIWQDMFSHLKVNKTVKIPFTHLWNINSNVETMILSHTSPLPIARSMAKGKWENVVALGEKYGMIDNDQLKNALGEAVSKLDYKEGDKTGMWAMVDIFKRLGKELYMAEDSMLGRGFRWAYGWEDKIFKLTAMQDNIYKAKLEMYKQKHGELSLVDEYAKFDEIDAMKLNSAQEYKAFKEANALFADYQKPLPKTWRVLDQNVVPFLKYTVRSTPITIKLMIKNPMTALALNMAGGGYMARGGALVAGYAGLESVAEYFGGLYQDMDEKAHESFMAKNGTIFGFDMPDNLLGIDNWRAIDKLETPTHVTYLNQGRAQPGVRGDALDSILTLGMIGQVLGYTTGVDLRTKREFYHEDDPASMKAKNALSKMIQDVSPGLIGTYGPKYAEALMYGENIYGEPMDATDVTLQGMGIRRVAKTRAEVLKQKEITTRMNKYVNADERTAKAKKEHELFISSKGAKGLSKRKYDERIKTITEEKEAAKEEMEKLKALKTKVDKWSPYTKEEAGGKKKAFDIGIDIGIKKKII